MSYEKHLDSHESIGRSEAPNVADSGGNSLYQRGGREDWGRPIYARTLDRQWKTAGASRGEDWSSGISRLDRRGRPAPPGIQTEELSKGERPEKEAGHKTGEREMTSKWWEDPEDRARRIAAIKKSWGAPGSEERAGRIAKMRRQEARARYSAAGKKRWKNPEYRAMRSASAKKMWGNPEYRATVATARTAGLKKWLADPAARSLRARKLWGPQARAKRIATLKKNAAKPEVRARLIAQLRDVHADPEVQARRIANMKKTMQGPEARERKSSAIKRTWLDAKTRERRIAGQKKALAKPEVRARLIAQLRDVHADPEVQARRIANLKETLAKPEVRARNSAASKTMWEDPSYIARVKAGRLKAARRLVGGDGRRPKDIWSKALALREQGMSPAKIAARLTPKGDRRLATDRMRKGLERAAARLLKTDKRR